MIKNVTEPKAFDSIFDVMVSSVSLLTIKEGKWSSQGINNTCRHLNGYLFSFLFLLKSQRDKKTNKNGKVCLGFNFRAFQTQENGIHYLDRLSSPSSPLDRLALPCACFVLPGL